jgi:tRNA threonylcarbamoyladenosine biosynthesis protein TsaE
MIIGMAPDIPFNTTSYSPEDTFSLGRRLGGVISAPIVIALIGDLGSGKTLFVQGLASGLNVPEAYYITSPSYTLINEYPGRLPLCHADLYRLEDGADIESTGLYDRLHSKNVVAIEWAERIAEEYLAEHLALYFEIIDSDRRNILIKSYGQSMADLLRELKKIEERK